MTFDTRGGSKTISRIADAAAEKIVDGCPALLGHLLWSASHSFAYGLVQPATDEQGNHRTGQQRLDDMRFAGGQFDPRPDLRRAMVVPPLAASVIG